MSQYTMPDGSIHDFDSDEIATQAYKAWEKQFGSKTTWRDDLQGAVAKTMGTMAQGIGLGAEVLSRPFGEQDKAIEDTEAMVDYWKTQDPTLGKEQGAGKLVNAAVALPMYMSPPGLATMMAGSTRQTGTDIIKEGGDTGTALLASGADLGMQGLGAAVPVGLVVGAGKNAIAGAGSNIGQEIANRGIQNEIREGANLEQLPSMDAWDAAAAGIPGAGMGFAFAKPKVGTVSETKSRKAPEVSGKEIRDKAVQQRQLVADRLETEVMERRRLAVEDNLHPEEMNYLNEMESNLSRLRGEIEAIQGIDTEVKKPVAEEFTKQGSDVDVSKKSNPFFKSGDPTKINVEGDVEPPVNTIPGVEATRTPIIDPSTGREVAGRNFGDGTIKVNPEYVQNLWGRLKPETKLKFSSFDEFYDFVQLHEREHNRVTTDDLASEKLINNKVISEDIPRRRAAYEEAPLEGKPQTEQDFLNRFAQEDETFSKDTKPLIEDESFSQRQAELDTDIGFRFKKGDGKEQALGNRKVREMKPLSTKEKGNPVVNTVAELKGMSDLDSRKAILGTLVERMAGVKTSWYGSVSSARVRAKYSLKDILDLAAKDHNLTQGRDGDLPLVKYDQNGYIDVLEIPEKYRNTGLGKEIVKTIEQEVGRSTFVQAEQDSVKFWEKLGYKRSSEVEEAGENVMMYKERPGSKSSFAKSQSGMIDPSVVTDLVKNTKTFLTEENTRLPKYTDANTALKAMELSADISTVGKVLGTKFGKRGFGKIYEDNPLINYTVNSLNKAQQKATEVGNNLWYGFSGVLPEGGVGPFRSIKRLETEDSPSKVLSKASNSSVNKVMKAFEDGFDRGQDYKQTLDQYRESFSPQELKLWSTLERYFQQLSVGIKETRKGWFPAVRKGNYMVKLYLNDTTVHAETFRSEVEAKHFIDKWGRVASKEGIKASTVFDLGDIYKNQQIDFELATKLTDIIANEIAPGKQQEIKKLVDTMLGSPDPFKPHQKRRTGIKGYEGSRLFKNDEQVAQAWRESLHAVADEYAQRVRRGMINKDLIPIVDSPTGLESTHPNTVDAVKLLRDHAMNKLPNYMEGFDTVVRESSDKLATDIAKAFGNENWFPKHNSFDKGHAVATRLFYIKTLTSRVGFSISQVLAAPLSVREVMRDGSLMNSLAAAGKGSLNVLYGGSKDFVQAVNWTKQNTTTFHPSFLNDLNQLGKKDGHTLANHVFEILSGEKLATAADSLSRYWTFSMMFEKYKSDGFTGKELYNRAAEATNNTMIMYGREDKSPLLDQMGIVGQAVSPLMTFSLGNLANFVADIRHAKTTGNIKPALYTILMTSALGGVVGAPFVAEWELMRKLLLAIDDSINVPSIIDTAYKELPDWASLGVVSSTTGMDIGSSLRWNPLVSGVITGEQDFLSLAPAFNFIKDMAKSGMTSTKRSLTDSVSDAEYRKSQMDMTPGGYKGVVDDLMFDAKTRDYVPDNKGQALVKQTDKERLATYLGTKTVERTKAEKVGRLLQESELKRTSYIGKRIDLIVDALKSGNSALITSKVKELADKQVPSDKITSMVETELKKRNIPLIQRFISGTSGRVDSQEQQRKYLELLKYHIDLGEQSE